MNHVCATFQNPKRVFSSILEGVTSKNFRSVHSRAYSLFSSAQMVPPLAVYAIYKICVCMYFSVYSQLRYLDTCTFNCFITFNLNDVVSALVYIITVKPKDTRCSSFILN